MFFIIIVLSLFSVANTAPNAVHFEILGALAREPGTCHVKTDINLDNVKIAQESLEQKIVNIHEKVRSKLPNDKMKSQWDRRMKNVRDIVLPAKNAIETVYFMFGFHV